MLDAATPIGMFKLILPLFRALHALGFWQIVLSLEKRFGWRRHIIVLLYHHIAPAAGSASALSELEDAV